jgi:hypothetical protein
MKTYKLTLATMVALTLITLTAAIILAAPTEPGKELKTELGNAPILPPHKVVPHSDEWNSKYFDRNVATTLPYYFEYTTRGQMRGGLAKPLTTDLKPIAPHPTVKAHSDSWNTYYFDRNVNTRFIMHEADLEMSLRRGGLAK